MDEQQIRATWLPYGKQSLDEEDIQAVVDVLRGDYLTTGPAILQFERAVANYVGAKYAVAFCNGTAALHAACFAAGIEAGDEVITTPMTFVASANCVLYQGGTPVFADIDPLTYNMDPHELQRKITPRTKAIIPVHFTGQPVDLEQVYAIAREHQLVVIEDAAHALGATYKGERIGAYSDMAMFSFHPVKHITSGEGGMITTNNPHFYEQLMQFRTHGITRNREKLTRHEGPWYYEMQFLGYNYRMTDIQAALGASQLKKSDYFLHMRRKYAAMYTEAFVDMPEIVVPFQQEDAESSWHIYVIALQLEQLTATREQIFIALTERNIGVNVHYIPVHLQPFYEQRGFKYGDYPVAEQLYERLITLPLFPAMTEQDVQDVIVSVKQVVECYRK